MLKQRIITAIILIPLFIYLVLQPSIFVFAIVTFLLVLIGAWEWSGLMEVKSPVKKLIYPIFITLICAVLYFSPYKMSLLNMFLVTFVWWCSSIFLIISYPESSIAWSRGTIVRAIMGMFVLIPCWFSINFMHASPGNGPYILLFLFILIWGADIAAYFVGRKWGRKKLAPNVSPGKSWEGFWGALVATIIITLVALAIWRIPGKLWPPFMAICIITVIFSVIGDLFESMLKRKAGLKDSGVLLPGHGGVLDRIDSLTAAAPVFSLGVILLGKYFHP